MVATLVFGSMVFAEEPTSAPSDASAEIQAIRARIAQLEAKHNQEEHLRQEAEQKLDARVTADELAQNAVRHDQLLDAGGFTAGYSNDRFVIQSEDGNFTLRPWAHFQFRGIVNERNGFQGNKIEGPEDEANAGFEVRQLRIGVDGNMFSPDLTYFINWATQRTSANNTVKNSSGAAIGTVSNSLGGGLVLQQAWVKYRIPSTPFFLKAGQSKDPVLHEQIVDTRFQQVAERSIAADIFVNGDAFTEEATVIYDPNADIRVPRPASITACAAATPTSSTTPTMAASTLSTMVSSVASNTRRWDDGRIITRSAASEPGSHCWSSGRARTIPSAAAQVNSSRPAM